MKVLFVCKHNRFRSKVAEVIFNKLNKNKKITVESAGLILDKAREYVEPIVVKLMKDKGYSIGGKPRQVTREFVNKFDLLIIVADNVDEKFFHDFSGKIIKWKISDVSALAAEEIKDRINKIEEKVKELVKSLEK